MKYREGRAEKEGIQYHLLEDSAYNNLRKHRAEQVLSLAMWHICLGQPPSITQHVSYMKNIWGGTRWL